MAFFWKISAKCTNFEVSSLGLELQVSSLGLGLGIFDEISVSSRNFNQVSVSVSKVTVSTTSLFVNQCTIDHCFFYLTWSCFTDSMLVCASLHHVNFGLFSSSLYCKHNLQTKNLKNIWHFYLNDKCCICQTYCLWVPSSASPSLLFKSFHLKNVSTSQWQLCECTNSQNVSRLATFL